MGRGGGCCVGCEFRRLRRDSAEHDISGQQSSTPHIWVNCRRALFEGSFACIARIARANQRSKLRRVNSVVRFSGNVLLGGRAPECQKVSYPSKPAFKAKSSAVLVVKEPWHQEGLRS